MELKFVAATRPEKVNATIERRQRLLRQIDRQIVYVSQIKDGQQVRASWVWMDENGKYFVPLKYGRQSIELKKGMFSVQCDNLDEVEKALGSIRAMVPKGDFDDNLAKASSDIRSRFKRNAK